MFSQFRRNFSLSQCRSMKIAICGASGNVGEPLSMLVKLNPMVTDLRMQDVSPSVEAIAIDASHIEYPSCVSGHVGEKGIKNALKDVDVVVFAAEAPAKPGTSSDDIFKQNANLAKMLAEAAAEACPKAFILTITDPIHSLVPLIVETMKKKCVECVEKRVFGVTTLDNVRANSIASKKLGISPKEINIPTIGGHTAETIIPVFSKAIPKVCLPAEDLEQLTCQIQQADNVIKQKGGTSGPKLAKCYASARFINSILCAIKGDQNITECAFVKSDFCPAIPYFAGPVTLGKDGAECICKIQDLNEFEQKLLTKAVPILQKDVQKGIEFAHAQDCKPEPKKQDNCSDDKKKNSDNKKKSNGEKKNNDCGDKTKNKDKK